MSIPALVLAAGLGTRLDPLTRLVAKPAVPLGQLTLIEHVLGRLAAHGIGPVVVNLHHRPETITAVVGDGRHLGVPVRYSWEALLLGSAGGPRHALPLIDARTFVIANGDTLSDVDLGAMVAAHRASGAAVTMAVVANARPHHYNGIRADAAGMVTGFVPRGPGARESWHFVGVQVVETRVFAGIADGVPAETVHGLYRDLVASGDERIRVWPTTGRFIDVGTPRDYLEAAIAFTRQRAAASPVTRSVIWPGCIVPEDAVLDRCVVAGRVVVPAGFEASEAILVPAGLARASDHVRIRDGVAVFPLGPAA